MSAADIVIIVILGIGLVLGAIGGIARAFKGVFAAAVIVVVSLLLVGVTMQPIQQGSLGTSLSNSLQKKTEGWGEAYTAPVYISRDGSGNPIMDGENYTYYIKAQDGSSHALENAEGDGLVKKTKAKLAVRLARRFITEETEGQSLAGLAALAITTIILDIVLFIIYAIALGLIFFVLRLILKKVHRSDSLGVRVADRILGAILVTGLAFVFCLIVLAIIRAAAGEGGKVGTYMTSSPFAGYLYTHNPMSQLLQKIFG